ncbi:hypothetical protein [Xanthomonas phaseoli]|uniref:hypothetical protein n=1 Tax=Xanthomonas phaseoli TaxID=1985254 RepID=UPI00123741C1|nr:hypothetical protein [Xanthomonas phaseoli]UZB29359.1 hypothetical protein OM951_01555 [Xanthomonas phaseoli pv. phaseoli]
MKLFIRRRKVGAVLVALLLFSVSAFAQQSTIVYQDFYGTAQWNNLQLALQKAQANATNYAFVNGFQNCVFVGYQWYRPDLYNPNWYQVTASYTCSKAVLG